MQKILANFLKFPETLQYHINLISGLLQKYYPSTYNSCNGYF